VQQRREFLQAHKQALEVGFGSQNISILQKAIMDAQAAFYQFPEVIAAKQALQSLQTQAASMPASAQSPVAPMGQAGPYIYQGVNYATMEAVHSAMASPASHHVCVYLGIRYASIEEVQRAMLARLPGIQILSRCRM